MNLKITKFNLIFFLTLLLIGLLFIFDNGLAQTQNQINSRMRVAQDLERRGNFETALRIYRNLFDLVPNNQFYYEGVKRNMIRLKMFDQLSDLIRDQISHTNNPRFRADLGNVYYKSGAQDQAFEIWNALLKKYAQNRAVYPYVATAMLDNRLYDEAASVYRTARKNLKNDYLFVFELANIYVIRLNYKEATLEYLKYLERNPQQFNYIEGRIASYTKEAEQAQEVAEILLAYLSVTKHEYLIRKQLADLYLRIEEYGNSLKEFKILENMDNPLEGKKKADGREIYFFAEKSLSAGEYEYAQQAFELILSKYKNSPYKIRTMYGLALTKQKQGKFAEAIENFKNMCVIAPKSIWTEEALFQIGEIYLEAFFDLNNALDAYQRVVKEFPKGRKLIDAFFRIGDCYAAKGNLKTAVDWYQMPMRKLNTNTSIKNQVLYKSAYVDFMQGDFDQALEKLNKITESINKKDNVDQSFVNDALELIMLIEENKQNSEAALKNFGQAQKLKLQRKYSEAIQLLQENLKAFPDANILDDSLIDLGELENERGNFTLALNYFQSLLENHPKSIFNAFAQKRIGDVYAVGLGDYQSAYKAYEKVLINYPQSLYLEEVRQKLRELQTRPLNN